MIDIFESSLDPLDKNTDIEFIIFCYYSGIDLSGRKIAWLRADGSVIDNLEIESVFKVKPLRQGVDSCSCLEIRVKDQALDLIVESCQWCINLRKHLRPQDIHPSTKTPALTSAHIRFTDI